MSQDAKLAAESITNIRSSARLTEEQVFAEVATILSDSFELARDRIRPESTLYEELDLDSIDAIDIFTQLREITGRRPDPAEARKVRTVAELVDFVFVEMDKTARGVPEVSQATPGTQPFAEDANNKNRS